MCIGCPWPASRKQRFGRFPGSTAKPLAGPLVLTFGYFAVEWTGPGLNRRHLDFQSSALPTELPVRERSRNSLTADNLPLQDSSREEWQDSRAI
jgi:hypothetical protein